MKKQQRQLKGMSGKMVLEYNSLLHFQIPCNEAGSLKNFQKGFIS